MKRPHLKPREEMKTLKIRCSKHNEVNFSDIKPFIKLAVQVHRGIDKGVLVGQTFLANGNIIKLYSNDEVEVHNVRFCLAAARDSYFCNEIQINIPDEEFELVALENSVKERKLTARAAEIELLKKYDMDELENVLPYRRIEVIDFDNRNLWQQNGECVTGEFLRKWKIHDNVEYCKDTQRFEYIEYFVKDEDEE